MTNRGDAKLPALRLNESGKQETWKRELGQNLQNIDPQSSLSAFLIDLSESVNPAAARRFFLYAR